MPASDPRFEIWANLTRCQRLLATGVLSRRDDPLFEAAVTTILIGLNDLLQKADRLNMRVDFKDNVDQIVGKERDVTDLISICRNAACHITSPLNTLGGMSFVFNTVRGKYPSALNINGAAIGCDFEDDMAIYWGSTRLYLKRHLLSSLEIVAERLSPLLKGLATRPVS